MSVFERFKADRRGTTAVIFALCTLPVVGAAGVAIDYTHANTSRTALQKIADETALMMVIARHDGRTLDHQAVFNDLVNRSPMAADLRAFGALTIGGTWLAADREFKVTAVGALRTSLGAVFRPSLTAGVTATAVGVQEVTQSGVSGTNLNPEAADYNEIRAYCYKATTKERLGPIDGTTGLRTAFPKIADNTDGGVRATPSNLNISCGTDEQISYLVRNIRDARTDVVKQRMGTARLFYTDATKDEKTGVLGYAVTMNGVTRDTLETILCDRRTDCMTVSQGGTMPNEQTKNRTPSVNAKVCAPGKYLYFGWEDRIPGYPGDNSDSDFDDIRLVVTCPTTTLGPFRVRLSA